MKKLEPKALLDMSVGVDFEVGCTIKTIEEILNLKKGAYVKLEKSKVPVIPMVVGGKKIAEGFIVRQNGLMLVKLQHLFN